MNNVIRYARRSGVFAPLAAAVLLQGCGKQPASAEASAATAEVAIDQSLPVSQALPAVALPWLHPTDASRNLVVGAAGFAGLTLTGFDGTSHAGATDVVPDAVAIAYGFGARSIALIVAYDRTVGGLRAFSIDPDTLKLTQLTTAPLKVDAELTGLCLYRSPATGKFYAFVATDPGMLQQWELSEKAGAVTGRMSRAVAVGSGAAHCVADDAQQVVYVADETIGIWKIGAEPEANMASRELLAQTAPRGVLGEEVKGLALRRAEGNTWLLATDEEAATVHVLVLPDGNAVGKFKLAGAAEAKFEAIAVGNVGAVPREAGVVLLPDEGGGTAGVRVLRWDAVATALKLPATAPLDPRVLPPLTVHLAEPTVETEPVLDHGDAADDPAIWIHPRDPAKSLIIGAQKKRGIEVYNLGGKRMQVLADGRTNNVDVRQGVELGGKRRDVVAGSNRDAKTLTLYEVDATGRLADAVAAPIPTGFGDPYGLCMYHSAKSGKLYVFVNDPDKGDFRQWEIEAVGNKLGGRLVREFTVGTQAEGCVADDETGALYIAEEDVGLWRYGAEPDAGVERRQLDSSAEGGHLQADSEGVAIFRGKDGTGFVVLSNQGADNYAVYRREGDNAFVGLFSIVANDELGIDGASETDGLDVTSTPLGRNFPQGLVVVQDGRNITPTETQNFKLVPWERVAAALGL